ncbi:hypothetical protein MOC98_04260 [Bacillus spizizenii]|uniref:Uncharacterized protein n=1 Tax=Bacillus spizizenii TaxID=96241 RepID=A0A9Q4E3X6_BACSC|nr:hypothetical protein [Bacillus spizizenii]MCY8457448.1 hypothetical protein [Bacillus spizizenii]
MDDLARLICGDYAQHKSIESLYDVLFNNIKNMETRIDILLTNDSDDLTLLGPFYARNILESSCSALIGRFDPFRLIYVHKIQSLDNYSIGKKSNGGINWNGDVFEKKSSGAIWNPDKEFQKVGRGLFGDAYGDTFWNPAYQMLIDDETIQSNESLDYYKSSVDPDKFTEFLRTRSSKIYSSLSKGVHSEFLIKPEIIYDKSTVVELLLDAVKFCSIIGLVSHYIDSCICRLPYDNAFVIYQKLYDWVENHYE